MYTRYFRSSPLIATVIIFLAAGCSTAGNSAGLGSASEPDITLAALPTADLAGLYIAQDNGLFAQQGLRVTIEKIPSSAAIIADQLRGEVDISAGSYVPYIVAQAAGAKFRILAEASTLRPDTRALVITADSRITTVADLAGKTIGVNGTNSIGTLLISALLSGQGISPGKVHFITDSGGFPVMPGQLRDGNWDAAFLAEPYVSLAGEKYGERVFVDLDQGATLNFPIDGYVATQAWAKKYPKTAAAFVRAIEEGQALADTDRAVVEAAIGKSDHLPSEVTAVMALPDFPTGPVDEKGIQREAEAMLQFGMLGSEYATEVQQGVLVESMVSSGS
jgi:NitT/TauT family transport system substrate-binding protein